MDQIARSPAACRLQGGPATDDTTTMTNRPATDDTTTMTNRPAITHEPATTDGPGVTHPRVLLDAAAVEALRQRARDDDPEWIALRDRCDFYLLGHVNPPGVDRYPDGGSIGEGYQFDEYFAAVCNVGLAYVVAQGVDAERARRYGAKGVEILHQMSTPEGDLHAPDPLRDQGYGIRYAGVGMALAYDWLSDAMTPEERFRVYTAINRWLAAYEEGGLGRDHVQGNYVAGYIAAKALAALATEGDNPLAGAHWEDFLERVHEGMVRPYYDANLGGAGWPEGLHYGPSAIVNMLLPVAAAKTAKDLDLVNTPTPYGFALAAARAIMHQTSPSLLRMDDRGTLRDQPEPVPAPVREITQLAGMLPLWADPMAPAFHRFAADVRAANPDSGPRHWRLWSDFLFFAPGAPEEDYTTGPPSSFARGMETGAVRSSWQRDAVWAILGGGPYTANPNIGEQLFDAGSLSIARGDRSFLVNVGELFRGSGPNPDQFIYDQMFSDDAPRGLFSILLTGSPTPGGQQARTRADGARTHMSAFEDRASHVLMRASHLEDMYVRDHATEPAAISSWDRTVLYLRPGLFAVHDRTTVTSASAEPRIRWQVAHAPARAAAPSAGVSRYDVGTDDRYAGTVSVLLPAGHLEEINAAVFDGSEVAHLDVRPGSEAEQQHDWLAVLDPAADCAEAAHVIRLSNADGNVLDGGAVGALLQSGDGDCAVLFSGGVAGATIAGRLRYRLPAAPTLNVVADLAPGATYTVTTTADPGGVLVELVPGPGSPASRAGVLSFTSP
jgi:hypothetical protein